MNYLYCFLAGGAVVAAVSFVSSKTNGLTAALVGSVPVLFMINLAAVYHNGGLDASLDYARGSLFWLPFFVLFVLCTLWLLPRIGSPLAVLASLPVFAVPAGIRYAVARHNRTASTQDAAETPGTGTGIGIDNIKDI